MPQVGSSFSPYFTPGPVMPAILGPDPVSVGSPLSVVPQTVVTQQKMPRSDRLEVRVNTWFNRLHQLYLQNKLSSFALSFHLIIFATMGIFTRFYFNLLYCEFQLLDIRNLNKSSIQ